jgi:hypothetical protein
MSGHFNLFVDMLFSDGSRATVDELKLKWGTITTTS